MEREADTAPEKKTRQAFIWTSILQAPFWTLYVMLIFILKKSLNATPLQITTLIVLRPVVSLFSVYWSAFIHKRPDRLRTNVIVAGLIGFFPFFLFPFIQNPWFLVGAGALFLMMERGIIPAWMEILKRNLPKTSREKTFSTGSSISFVSSAILCIFFGLWMDRDPNAWRLLFPLTALLSLCGMFFQWRIPMQKDPEDTSLIPIDLKATFLKPWKNAWHLFKTRPDFTRFQLGFMLGGGGLMVISPALPTFFIENLQISYTELAIALSLCKGMGFALTSRIWANSMNRLGIFRFSSLVTFLASLFPLAILLATTNLAWIYIAYLFYGIMQAGSKLSWHLSGPIFSQEEDSSVYSSVNVVTVGLRGLFAPFLGFLLCQTFGAPAALLLGGALCALASIELIRAHSRHAPEKV